MEVRAFSKINLFLNIASRRVDGYHNIESVMQSLAFCDTIRIQECGEHSGQVALTCSHPSLKTNHENLIVKAALLLMREFGIASSIAIHLEKRIPIGAGLGGGSSNCAATLHGLNHLFKLGIDLPQLMRIGASLGADVPFCLHGGTAIARGIGEELSSLPAHPPCAILLASPSIHVSTAAIFGKLSPHMFNSGATLDTFLEAYKSHNLAQIAANLSNSFTVITGEQLPLIPQLISAMLQHGALGANMTGTGSTVFGYFNNENDANKARDILQQKYKEIKFITTTLI